MGVKARSIRKAFKAFVLKHGLKIDANSSKDLVTFAEMDVKQDTPEITTDCWKIFKQKTKQCDVFIITDGC